MATAAVVVAVVVVVAAAVRGNKLTSRLISRDLLARGTDVAKGAKVIATPSLIQDFLRWTEPAALT